MSQNQIPESFIEAIKGLDRRVRELELNRQRETGVLPDTRLYLEGSDGDTYIIYNSASSRIEFYVNGVLEGFIDAANTGTRLANV